MSSFSDQDLEGLGDENDDSDINAHVVFWLQWWRPLTRFNYFYGTIVLHVLPPKAREGGGGPPGGSCSGKVSQ